MTSFDNEDNLTDQERASFAALSRAAALNDLAEERTVAALRSRGLLRRQHRGFRIPALVIAAIAAALLIFIGGMEYGRHQVLATAERLSPELRVQRAGSEYVAAMVKLSQSNPLDSGAIVTAGLEAGTTALRAAAFNAAKLLPDDPTVGRIRDGLDVASGVARPERPLVWF